MGAEGQEHPHPHAFYRDGEDKRFTKVEVSPQETNQLKPSRSYELQISHNNLYLQVDASAGKDKLVGKVTSGIIDLLGTTRGLLSDKCNVTYDYLQSSKHLAQHSKTTSRMNLRLYFPLTIAFSPHPLTYPTHSHRYRYLLQVTTRNLNLRFQMKRVWLGGHGTGTVSLKGPGR